MPQTRNQLRRRQQNKSNAAKQTRKSKNETPTEQEQPPQQSALKQNLLMIGRLIYFALLGLLCAASFSRIEAGLILFTGSVGAMFLSLLLVFMSILRNPDQTPIQLPTVHYKDGTVRRPEPMTVHQHDNEIATYFAKELPALAAATAWFYMWASFRPIFFCYSIYLAYRIAYHPLFRIHLWKEPDCPEFERPFGGVPLFKADDPQSAVKVVEGRQAFEGMLAEAGEKLVVVDFSAVWCGPCKAMAPMFKEMAQELGSDHVFVTVDVDTSQDVAEDQNISSIPTFILFKKKERVEMLRGADPKKLREAIQRHS